MRKLLMLLCLSLFKPEIEAQCDPDLTASDNAVLQYKDRGNRCEGFYRSKVSNNSKLYVVSCTWGDFKFKNEKGEVITLSVPGAGEQSVKVRAQGIPVGLYYRMDAALDGKKTLKWDANEVLLKYPDTKMAYNIGLRAFFGDDDKLVFVPVAAASKLLSPTNNNAPAVVVQLMCNTRLAAFSWQLDGGGWKKLEGPFRDGKPVRLQLPANTSKGKKHKLEVKYRLENDSRDKIDHFSIQL